MPLFNTKNRNKKGSPFQRGRGCSWYTSGDTLHDTTVCLYAHTFIGHSFFSVSVISHTVQWPSGKYGLPMAKSGCPKANGFSWETGYIYQDLEDDKSLTQTSSSFHLNATVFSSGDVSRNFCLKMNRSATVDNSRFRWPAGQYCIYKKGGSCPKLLLDGWVLWDDENGKTGANLNFQSGTLPAGIYKKDTKIYFCCQTFGSRSDPIELPIESPFYLIAYNSRSCQEVLKTIHTLEYIRYDTENDMNQDSQAHTYPYGADLSMPYIYYCYYRGKAFLLLRHNTHVYSSVLHIIWKSK